MQKQKGREMVEKMKKITQEKAITLITLIITIILLLILAGISIEMLIGEKGILMKASTATKENLRAEQEECLKLIGSEVQAEKILEQLNKKEFMDRFQEKILEEIQKGKCLEGATIERKDDETIHVITKDKDVYKITENEVKYIGKLGENPPPNLQETDINFKLTPKEGYTNTFVEIEIILNIEIGKNTLQYSTDGINWFNYTKKINIQENGSFYARIINELGETGESATQMINIIDKEIPNEATITFNSNYTDITQSVTATVTQSDRGVSGVDITKCKWVYTTNGNSIGMDETKYTGGTFNRNPEDLILSVSTPGSYYLHVLTVDKAENKKETIAKEAVVVNDIDRTPPTDAEITLSATRIDVGKTVTAMVKVNDNQSGIDLSKCKYIINNSADKLGIDSNSWSLGTTLTAVTSNVSLTASSKSTLYLHVLSVDKYNNKTETVSAAVYFVEEEYYLNITKADCGTNCVEGDYCVIAPSGWRKINSSTYLYGKRGFESRGSTAYLESSINFDLTSVNMLSLSAGIKPYSSSYTARLYLQVLDVGSNTVIQSKMEELDWNASQSRINMNLDVRWIKTACIVYVLG